MPGPGLTASVQPVIQLWVEGCGSDMKLADCPSINKHPFAIVGDVQKVVR